MKPLSSSRRRLSSVGAVSATVVVCGLVIAGCQADPGDAPTVDVDDEQPAGDGDSDGGGDAEIDDDAVTAVPEELRTITVGVDTVPSDLNPHLVGSRSMITSAVADLTLPSAFNVGEDGSRTELNTALIDSVEVLSGEEDAPTEVRYTLAGEAQWSDGTPISGSDFDYLRTQIDSTPGATGTAGYGDIDNLAVSAGGTTVTVEFSRPQPDWRQLFAHLLPSHIYGAEGRSFDTLMEVLPAASGGVYTVRQFDSGRGNLVLERNTRYWGETPAGTDRIVLSASGDLATGTQMLRTGQFQMLTTRDGAVVEESLEAVPTVGTGAVDVDNRLELIPNTDSPRLASSEARQTLMSAIDPDQVARLVTGDPDATSPEGFGGPVGAEGAPDDAADLLGSTDADPLRIAADTLDDEAVEAARRVVDQLEETGVPATVVTPTSNDLFSSFLPRGEVDVVIAWQDRERTVTDMRSAYSCDPAERPVTAPTQELPTESDVSTSEEPPEPESATESESEASGTEASGTTSATAEPGDSELTARAANISGICDDELDDLLDQGAVDEARDYVGGLHLGLPLLGDRVIVARSPQLLGPSGRVADWPLDERTGPFVSAGQWYRAGDMGEEEDSEVDTDTTGEAEDE